MPYKNPEHKRQWEREHREQRNAARRKPALAAGSRKCIVPKPVPDPVSARNASDGWRVLSALAIGVGIAVLGAFAGVKLPDSSRECNGDFSSLEIIPDEWGSDSFRIADNPARIIAPAAHMGGIGDS